MGRTSWGAMAAVVVLAAGGVGVAVAATHYATEWVRKNVTPPQPTPLATRSGRVELRFPPGWSPEEGTPFDLQAFSKLRRAMTGVFEFQRADFAEATTPHDVLELQIEDMRSRREDFALVEAEKTAQDGGRTFTTVLYTAKLDGTTYDYRFTLVEFQADPDLFLVVLQVAVPAYRPKAVPVFDAIVRSAAVRPAAPAPDVGSRGRATPR